MSNIIVAVDIGSSKIATIIAKVSAEGRVHVLGDGLVACKAIRKLSYTDEDAIVKAIRQSVSQAQNKADVIVHSVYVNIHGVFLSYIKNEASISFDSVEHEFSKGDIRELIKNASKIDTFDDEKIVDIIPVKYIIDDETEVNDPLGLHGRKLSVDADIVVGYNDIVKTICLCVQKAGYVVDGVLPEAASVRSLLLRPSEQKENTLFIDVGGTLTDFSIYEKNAVYLNNTIPIGGDHITSDVAKVFSITISEAENIKRDVKAATKDGLGEDRDFSVYHLNNGDTEILKASSIVEVMEARIYEIFEKVREKIEENGYDLKNINNIVVTGEGVKNLEGIDQIITDVLGLKPRYPQFFVDTGYSPVFAVAYSMVNYIANCLDIGRSPSMVVQANTNYNVVATKKRRKSKLVQNVKGFLKEFFSLNKLE